MESIYTELALYGSKNECARTDTVLLPTSEVCDCTISLNNIWQEVVKLTLAHSVMRCSSEVVKAGALLLYMAY